MDQEPQAATGDPQEGVEAQYGDHPPSHSRKPGRRQGRREAPPEPIELLVKTIKHFFPGLALQMNRLPDFRRPEQVVYAQSHLLWLGILLFMMHLGSRRQLRWERQADILAQNLAALCDQFGLDGVADPDTLAYYAERIDPSSIEDLLAQLTVILIRMKALDDFRLDGYFTVAIDGSQVCTFDREPWPGCPSRKLSDGSVQYFSYVLDAKLVSPCGLALTLASEMLTNEGHKEFDKQDCELKAFPRLAAKLHRLFPRTPLCLLFDALYANQNVIRLVETNRWKYFITFKEGSMPERYAEAVALANLQERNTLCVQTPNLTQTFRWAEQLPIAEFTPNVIFCLEQTEDKEATNFVWLTNFHVCSHNVTNIANKGGRLRWKIENEGFNVQKNRGYEMEHPYSEHPNGFRVFYLLLLIAHYLMQLILHGSLLRSLMQAFGSAKNFARRLAESFRCHPLPGDMPLPGQIRFMPP